MPNPPKLLIKNMVCQRCVMTVEHILGNANFPLRSLMIGEVELEEKLNADEIRRCAQN